MDNREFDELQAAWNNFKTIHKSKSEIQMMIVQKHQKFMRRIRFMSLYMSGILTAFLWVYYDWFDGHAKPIAVNLLLVVAVLLMLMSQLYFWVLAKIELSSDNLLDALQKLKKGLKVQVWLAPGSLTFFYASWIAFMASGIEFTHQKYLMTFGMTVTFLVLLFFYRKRWKTSLKGIEEDLSASEK